MKDGEGMTILVQWGEDEFELVLTGEMVQYAISDFVNKAITEYLDKFEKKKGESSK